MSVFVFRVLDAKPHPNADALRVYQFGGATADPLQVVANLDNTYDVGDTVAVAVVGAQLRDGTKVRPARLRGVDSFGMALGRHEAPVGTDLAAEFCDVAPAATAEAERCIAWPSIELLHHVRTGARAAAEVREQRPPRLRYRAKVKLDGTNSGVQIWPDGRVVAQSRSQAIDPQNDNMGFAVWVHGQGSYFGQLAGAHVLVVYGEWCGKGIQKRTAISKIDRKIFVVFAAQIGDGEREPARVEVEPERLRALLPEHADVFVLPWLAQEFDVDFSHDARLEQEAARISDLVSEIEHGDPWVRETFRVDGIGEGIVLYPMLEGAAGPVDRTSLSELLFKAKGEKHQTVRQKRAAQIAPEVAQSIDDFARLVLAEARLEQGLTEACQGKAAMPQLGAFLKWMSLDIQKECEDELRAAGLTWPQVVKAVQRDAKAWFVART